MQSDNESENTPTDGNDASGPTTAPMIGAYDEDGEPVPSDKPMPIPSAVIRAQATARTIERSRHQRLDIGYPGGAYLVNGVLVDANGRPVAATPEEVEAVIAARRAAAGPKRM